MSDLLSPSTPDSEPQKAVKDTSVAYRVLARKYRPATFDEVIGQEAMVRTLKHSLESGRLPNAWMLTGVRGIGKTTTARLIARVLNCTGVDGKNTTSIEPCGKCDACLSIAEDRHVDVQEMDAASRTSVDDIREIIEGVRYGPVSARYKIYILDEVHMLSKNAFNALLKTLEEPPAHTKFIFATTEIRKVPITVLSRCQRFDLRRIEAAELTDHFMNISKKENVEADIEAIKLIARAADGSVRDGLSLLDQAIARGEERITEQDVKDMLGLADRGQIIDLCSLTLQGDLPKALDQFANIQALGADPLQTLQDLADSIHFLTRVQIVPTLKDAADLPELDKKLAETCAAIKLPSLIRAWQILLKGIGEVQMAMRPSDAAEMVLIRLAYASDLPSPDDLLRQLRGKKDLQTTQSSAESSASPTGGVSMSYQSVQTTARSSSVLAIAPQTETQIIEQPAAASMPLDFASVVALFAEKREAGLYAFLYEEAHVVRCVPGILEMRLKTGAQQNMIGRIAGCLKEWTGRQWMIAPSNEEGAPTLAEEEKKKEQERKNKAEAHPLFQATRHMFPTSKLLLLRQKKQANQAIIEEGLENELAYNDADDLDD